MIDTDYAVADFEPVISRLQACGRLLSHSFIIRTGYQFSSSGPFFILSVGPVHSIPTSLKIFITTDAE